MATRLPSASEEQKLAKSLKELQDTINGLSSKYGSAVHPSRQLVLSYAKGILGGLGALTAVAIVVPLMLWMLKGIQWIPLIGNFVTEITTQVEQSQQRYR